MIDKLFINNFKTQDLKSIGIDFFGYTTVDKIEFSIEVRKICEKNGCGLYGKSWACPPAVGTYEECKDKVLKYKNVFVFSSVYNIEDSFDFEGMMDAMKKFKIASHKLRMNINKESDFLMLASEGCLKCEKCQYPNPCIFKDEISPSIEAYCILVNKLALSASLKYINGKDTVTYFGMICFN